MTWSTFSGRKKYESHTVHLMPENNAVTLVSAADTEFARWSAGARSGRYTLVSTIDLLEDIVRMPRKNAQEVTRVVIDGGIDLDRFLLLVSTAPESFQGELLYIRRDGSGYLSTRELGNVRTVKAIGKLDVEVYLRWNGLPARPRTSYS